MMSALCHDIGKITATEEINGVIHAYSHETKGLPLINDFLGRITGEKDIFTYVLNQTRLHMKPYVMLKSASSEKSFNRLFDESIAPEELLFLAFSDNPKMTEEEKESLYNKLSQFFETMSKPYVMGKDLIEAGLSPDKSFSELLAFSHKLRLAGISKESALKQTLSLARKNNR